MILDYNLMFDNPSATITATTNSGNVVDLQNARDLGTPEDHTISVFAQVGTDFSSTNSGTLQIQVQGSTNNSAWTTYVESAAIAAAQLVNGAQIFVGALPYRGPGVALPRYLRLNYVVANAFTAGTIVSGMNLDVQRNQAYAAGINVAN